MSGFLVSIPFTRNGIAGTAVFGVGVLFAPSIAAAITYAQNTVISFITKNPADVVVFGTLTAVFSSVVDSS